MAHSSPGAYKASIEGVTLDFSVMIGGTMAPLCGCVKPLLQYLVHKNRRGSADVERVDAPAHGQRDEVVARIPHPRPEAFALRSEHQDDPAAVVRGPVRGLRAGRGAVAPALRRLGVGEEVGEVADLGDREVLDRARGGLADRRRDLGGAPLGAGSRRSRPRPRRCGRPRRGSAGRSPRRARPGRARGARAARRRRRSGTPRPPRRRPGGRPSRSGRRSAPAWPASPAPRSSPPCAAQIRSHPPRAAERLADRVDAVEDHARTGRDRDLTRRRH